MSHSSVLIHLICELLQKEYDPLLHEYVIEKAIPGTRMHPDITIIQKASKQIQCVVEIGYTRPEKLTAYRHQLKIPDVRWYDKQGILHGDVTEKTIRVSVGVTPSSEMAVYEVDGEFQCVDERCVREALYELGCCSEICAERCKACAATDADCSKEGCAETCFDCAEALLNSGLLHRDVHTMIVTDRLKAFFPSHCDACGSTWLAHSDDDDCEEVVWQLETLTSQKFGGEYGAMTRMSWDDACRVVRDTYAIDLDYRDRGFLGSIDDIDMNRSMAAVVNVVKRDGDEK